MYAHGPCYPCPQDPRMTAFELALKTPNASVFQAQSPYVDVTFIAVPQTPTLYIRATFRNLSTVSAAHIHTNYQGASGPIIAWLATSPEWQHGVLQNTPLTNSTPSYACCVVAPKATGLGCRAAPSAAPSDMCTLAAPPGTPDVSGLGGKNVYYVIQKNVCDSCPWVSDGTFLDVHGKNFQQIYGCRVVGTTPGLDMLASVPFRPVAASRRR